MNEPKRTEKHEAARASLPDPLKAIFDELVEDYNGNEKKPADKLASFLRTLKIKYYYNKINLQ